MAYATRPERAGNSKIWSLDAETFTAPSRRFIIKNSYTIDGEIRKRKANFTTQSDWNLRYIISSIFSLSF